MKVLELSLRNYRQFERVDLELPARVIGIFGENGSGKSTLMESIAFALYGVDAARTTKQEIRTHGVLTDCEVLVAFEHGGQTYQVRRALKGVRSAPEAELYVGDMLLASGVSEVDVQVQHLLHMDLRIFRASVYAEQKQLDAFSDVTSGKRKEMALRLLGIRPVDDARTAAKREAKRTKQTADELAPAIAGLAELEGRSQDATERAMASKATAKIAAKALREAEARLKLSRKTFQTSDRVRERVEQLARDMQTRLEQLEQLERQRDGLAARLDRLVGELEELPALQEELEALDGAGELRDVARRLLEERADLAEKERALADLPEIDPEAARAEAEAAEDVASEARERAADARARQDHEERALEEAVRRLARAAEADPSQPCPTCGRELGSDFAGYVAHCREEVAGAKRRVASTRKEAKAAETAATKAERDRKAAAESGKAASKTAEERARLEETVAALQEEIARLAEPFGGEEPDFEGLEAAVGRERTLRAEVAKLGERASHRDQLADDLAATVDRVEGSRRKLEQLAEEAEALAFDADAHERAARDLAAAEETLDAVRREERDASALLKEAEKVVSGLEGQIRHAKETSARVDELRTEARHLERTGMLLDGFRDHLVSRVGPELSREAEALFRDLTNREYDDLRIDDETLAIQIADGETYFPIERFSGSETDLANLALRVAISMHLSRVSGADVGMLVLDEILASLDQERKDLMVQAMGKLSSRFHQLFVITHAEQVKDQFPASIVVSKTDRRRSAASLI